MEYLLVYVQEAGHFLCKVCCEQQVAGQWSVTCRGTLALVNLRIIVQTKHCFLSQIAEVEKFGGLEYTLSVVCQVSILRKCFGVSN